MADFNLFLPTLLKFEGGWADNPNDPGGATNKGITFLTFRSFALPLLGIQPTLENLQALTDEQAGIIYKSEYWDKVCGDDIELQDLADIVFDFAVNSGIHRAATLLQFCINECAMGGYTAEDGFIGADTIAALNECNQANVYRLYKAQRISAYREIAAADPRKQEFLQGWINRVNAFPDVPQSV